ncbi:MBOAT family O-acyltransferase, partial [Helicobacter sp. T3_23-1059]
MLENFNLFSQIAHLDFNIPLPHILLPLALSFVTFQQIAFLFDCYKHAKGQSNENLNSKNIDFIDYALFISFFPQLIAGPIVHHKEMMPQFAKMSANFSDSNDSSLRDLQSKASVTKQFITSPSLAKNTRPQTPPARGGAYIDSPSLAEGARGWVKSTQKSIDCHDSATKVAESRNDTINYEYLAKGIFIFSIGLFKKVFIADSFAKWANAGFSIVENGG